MSASVHHRLGAALLTVAVLAPSTFAQDAPKSAATRRVTEERTLSIYSNRPIGDEPNRMTELERYYDPFYFSPAAKAAQIAADPAAPTSRVDENGQGTHLDIAVRWTGANEFATIGFVPAGATRLGQLPGMNIAQLLGESAGHKVYLKFRARRPAGHPEVKAKFRVGGLAGAPHRDSLRFPLLTTPQLITLGDNWKEYSIDCTAQIATMTSVLCPFSVTLESNDNPYARPQDGSTDPVSMLYVDDIRFVAVREAAADQ
jgi:hypothetical protein